MIRHTILLSLFFMLTLFRCFFLRHYAFAADAMLTLLLLADSQRVFDIAEGCIRYTRHERYGAVLLLMFAVERHAMLLMLRPYFRHDDNTHQ